MTTPDPTPYLLPTDLRTAEDAARWLRSIVRDDDGALDGDRWPMEAAYASTVLDARLDRERRQACRRGALVSWRAASRIIRAAKDRRGRRRDRALTAAVWAPPWAPSSEDARLARSLLDHLSCALAFRAAARTP